MNGLGGLNKSPNGVVIGLVQLKLEQIDTPGGCRAADPQDRRDGTVIAHSATGCADEIVTAEVRPDLVREARASWGVENNIHQLGHRGFTAVKGGAGDCPYTFMRDLLAGQYRPPWVSSVKVTDGSSCGFAAPTRLYSPARGGKMRKATE